MVDDDDDDDGVHVCRFLSGVVMVYFLFIFFFALASVSYDETWSFDGGVCVL